MLIINNEVKKMKTLLALVLILSLGFVFVCCDEENDPVVKSEDQIVFVYAERQTEIYDPETNTSVHDTNTVVRAQIQGGVIPELESVEIAGNNYSLDDYTSFYEGYLLFGYGLLNPEINITSDYDPLTVEITTSSGTIIGTSTLPDTFTSLLTASPETIDVGESVTFTWSETSADFYSFIAFYASTDTNHIPHSDIITQMVADTSYTIDGSVLENFGNLSRIEVTPINGPFPEYGAAGNMDGYGTGFFYYDGLAISHSTIMVGARSEPFIQNSSQIPSRDKIRELRHQEIEKRIKGF